jgi:lipopolysaccharide/colanic/teichoic acid biosynthesis glycosyltransferase
MAAGGRVAHGLLHQRNHADFRISNRDGLMPTNYHARMKMTPKTQASHVSPESARLTTSLSQDSLAKHARTNAIRGSQSFAEYVVPDTKGANDSERSFAARDAGFGYALSKRLIDLVVGSVLLLVSVPIVFVAAMAIRINTPGSPFFFQTRLGKNGKPFKIFKLRGMYIDAKTRFPTYYDYSKKQDLEFCFHHEEDPRVTRAGKFIRKTSIDELPNLWNVVLGDMSLVGPRPEIPEVLKLYGGYKDEYLSVKPGITCLSKCTGRDRLTKRETIEFDLDYIRNRSFARDLVILWRTFRSVMLRRDVF